MAKTKSYGLGSIFKRGQRWYIGFMKDGKLKQVATGSTDRKVAVEMRLKMHQEQHPERNGGVLISELLDMVKRDYEINGQRTDTTFNTVEKRMKPYFGNIVANNLTSTQVNEYVDQRRKDGLANASINREMAVLKRAFTLGFRCDPPKINKLLTWKNLKEDNVREGFIVDEEYKRLHAVMPPHLKPVLSFAYFTGCRKGEVLNLRWEQVDLERGEVRLEPGTTKNKQARQIPLPKRLREELMDCKAERDRYFPECPWVFQRAGGKILRFSRAWERACEAAGLEGRIFHDLRRSGIRNLIRAGVTEKVAMKISGHRTRAVLDRYNITDDRDLTDAARKVDVTWGD